jgi:sugar lactone lactonase YvrE
MVAAWDETDRMTPYDDTPCELGEGPLWHPERGQLFWFDILGRRLLTREDGARAPGTSTASSPPRAGSTATGS